MSTQDIERHEERRQKQRRLLGFLLALAVLALSRQVLWVHLNPMFQAPDELQHLLMVGQMDRHGLPFYAKWYTLPPWLLLYRTSDHVADPFGVREVNARPENRQHFSTTGAWGPGEEDLHQPRFDQLGPDPTFFQGSDVFRYPPVYYWISGKAVGLLRTTGLSVVEYLFAIRMVNGFFLGLYLLFGYLGLLRFGSEAHARLGTSIMALHPMACFLSASSTPDIALVAIAALLFWATAGLMRRIPYSWPIGLLAASLLPLTKGQGVLFSSVVGGAAAVLLFYERAWRLGLKGVSLVGAGLAMHFVERWIIGETTLRGSPDDMGLAGYLGVLQRHGVWLIQSTLGQFGWGEVKFSPAVYSAFGGAVAATVVAACVGVSRRDSPNAVIARLGLSSFVGSWTLLLSAQYFMLGSVGYILQGRYGLPALPMLISSVLLMAGSSSGAQGRVFATASLALLLFFGVLSTYGLWALVVRFYDTSRGDLLFQVMQFKPAYFKSTTLVVSTVVLFSVSTLATIAFGIASGLEVIGIRTRVRQSERCPCP